LMVPVVVKREEKKVDEFWEFGGVKSTVLLSCLE
jgi:hypothetical protein